MEGSFTNEHISQSAELNADNPIDQTKIQEESEWGDWGNNESDAHKAGSKTNAYSECGGYDNKETNEESGWEDWGNNGGDAPKTGSKANAYSRGGGYGDKENKQESGWEDWGNSDKGVQQSDSKTNGYGEYNRYDDGYKDNKHRYSNNTYGRNQQSSQSNGWNGTNSYKKDYENQSNNNYKRNGGQNYNNNDGNAYDNFGDDSNNTAYQPITYEPAFLNYNENQLFDKKKSGGIDFSNYDKIDVEMTGGDGFKLDTISTFEQCNLHSQIYTNLQRSQYTTPTPIQKSVIPIITNTEHDIMACAQTGSGKTAAFILPIFSKMLKNNDYLKTVNYVPAPTVLLIGPTRELVNQLFMETQKFSWNTSINCSRVYGGVSRHFLLKGLTNNCHVLCATPGRLIGFLKNGEISLENIQYLIIDEADRMLDMGFIGDIKRIVNNFGLPECTKRRCYMFSATFPFDVQKLAAEILNPNFYFITVGMVGGAAETISQSIEKLPIIKKRQRLVEILSEVNNGTKILVFAETKRQADYLTIYLCESGFDAISIHGDRTQQQREQALDSFINDISPILVATSVAARGLDIPAVDIVLNFDMPKDVDEYVHRIGRTGRIGNRGLAISFFQEGRDEHLAPELVKILKNANQQLPEWLELLAGAGMSTNFGNSKQRDARFIDKNDDQKLFRQKFNAMNTNPYPNPSRDSYQNTTKDVWTNSTSVNTQHINNDDEEW